jgi:hypothetical protein
MGAQIMKTNVGSTDRWIRVIIGLGILALGFSFKSWWGLIGIIPIATAGLRFCALYTFCGVNTDHASEADSKPAA